ncbi:MAG: T9SS type A sorting domain-containing protein [Paludibacter sp.]|nr:T9SS type A sorting domain-containing protein [Paludibacter sp.]
MNFIKSNLLLLLFAFSGLLNAQTNSLSILKLDHLTQDFEISSVSKLTFATNVLNINLNAGSTETISLSDIQKITFNTVSGINNITLDENTAVVYPNPATNFIRIKNITGNNIEVNIYNLSGVRVLNKTLHNQTETLDVSGLSNGIYIVKANAVILKFSKL